MRNTFVRALVELAHRDHRVVFLTADLGYTVVEPFAEAFPDRFWNVGVAEQNMIGVATGLAEAGFLPFCYSIAPFATLRPLEFFRDGPVVHGFAVRLVGVGGGFEYGMAGPTHYGLEDVAVLRSLPGVTVIAPADFRQAASAVYATWDLPGPLYYRLGKDESHEVPGLLGRFRLGRLEIVRDGRDAVVLTLGAVARDAVQAAEELATRGVEVRVAVVPCLGPQPPADLEETLRGFPLVVTYEAHHKVGGLGSMVAEVIAERGLGCRLYRCAPENAYALDRVGGDGWMRRATGIAGEQLRDLVGDLVQGGSIGDG